MSPIRKRNLAVAGAITAALLAGGVGVALASTDDPTPQSSSAGEAEVDEADGAAEDDEATEGEANDGRDDGEEGDEGENLTGTVPAPTDASEESGVEDPAGEAAALAPLAEVTEATATTAALAAVPGTVGTAQLEDENGFVVWTVEVTAADGTITEVIVDAGDASILGQETEQEDDEAGDD